MCPTELMSEPVGPPTIPTEVRIEQNVFIWSELIARRESSVYLSLDTGMTLKFACKILVRDRRETHFVYGVKLPLGPDLRVASCLGCGA